MKGTYQATQNNKFIGYYQWGQKIQPNRLPYATYTYETPETTNEQNSGSWVYKAEWNGTVSEKLYVEARYGDFGYYFPLLANGDEPYFFRDTGLQTLTGSQQRWQLDRDRKQLTGAATYFLDTEKGSHTIKFGGEMLKEQGWEGYEQQFGGNIDHQYANNVSSQVVFTLPTAKQVGSISDNDEGNLTSRSALDVFSMFATDTWSVGRMTLSYGGRFDRYSGWLPEQEQLGLTVGPTSVAAKIFPEKDLFTWNQFAPRIGVVYDLTGDGRTVIKGNYGLFWHNPGVGVGSDSNPNTTAKSQTFVWNDVNRDRVWQPGEEGNRTASALEGTISLDPDIKAPVSHDASVFFERQIGQSIGVRTGFVYKTEDDLIGTFSPGRSVLNNAYSVAFPFTDVGVDGISGTSDDRVLTLHGMPSALASQFPVDQVVMNIPGDGRYSRYKSVEASLTKRFSNRWSGQVGFGHTWSHDYIENVAGSFPQTPDRPDIADRTGWGLKIAGTYDAAWGIRLSPLLRHQSGVNFARQISVPGTAGNAFGLVFPASTIYADLPEDNREDNIWVFDFRAEKTVSFTDRIKTRLFLDLFNLTNSHASEAITRTTGASYLRPANILAPRTARLGFRFLW